MMMMMIKFLSRVFCERVQPIEGAMELLMAAGFAQQKLTNADGVEEDFLVFNKENVPSVESLTVSSFIYTNITCIGINK